MTTSSRHPLTGNEMSGDAETPHLFTDLRRYLKQQCVRALPEADH